ncbi:polysaccharide pyruvyl transferase family protein [Roseobacter sinensis]|uniref:Polysaccharide pyruvyl transferase family protein n=1 Tax=Roseobacter sinensis TaxID=2931391 RepID=A0ABT3BJQ0_9RHOB|nr:polysaccharide pyruvyl transferase family protein [Roseobacter sp. WL0113]MCV3273808.1 polysaccharide pyruvyl transferase family protein [Roseobacter sp. WL0113]
MTRPALAHWNPIKRRFGGRIGRRLPFYAPVNNFGDLLGPMVVEKILERQNIAAPQRLSFEAAEGHRKLLSVGSVLHYANDGDVVWGAGRNGKIDDTLHRFTTLDVRMVRGPKTRAFLQARDLDVPELYGDPGLLVPTLFPEQMAAWQAGRGGMTLVPNLNDAPARHSEGRVLNPRAPVWRVLKDLYESEIVVSSSLHGFILAEAFGVKARLLRSTAEPLFKYEDYLQGTGRSDLPLYDTIVEALSAPDHPAPVFDPERMISACPIELFKQ